MKLGFFERGGWWVLGQSVLMPLVVALGPLTPGDWRWPGWGPFAWALLALGAFFGVGGAWVLGRNRTIFPHPNEGSRLVRHGVYRLVRHPLYASLVWLSAGWGLLWRSWLTLLAGLALTVFLIFKSRREERWLCAHFSDYSEYARQVRRLVPWVY